VMTLPSMMPPISTCAEYPSDDKNPATPDLQMIVNHDDPERAYEYAVDKVNHLAAENGWQVISMKTDWQRVYDFSK
jgi:hypothetical protein